MAYLVGGHDDGGGWLSVGEKRELVDVGCSSFVESKQGSVSVSRTLVCRCQIVSLGRRCVCCSRDGRRRGGKGEEGVGVCVVKVGGGASRR